VRHEDRSEIESSAMRATDVTQRSIELLGSEVAPAVKPGIA
jgi:hypothetical protein